MAIFTVFNVLWHITIHKTFTNMKSYFSSLKKCLFSYVYANKTYEQTVFLCHSPITLSKPRNCEIHLLLKVFFSLLIRLTITSISQLQFVNFLLMDQEHGSLSV